MGFQLCVRGSDSLLALASRTEGHLGCAWED